MRRNLEWGMRQLPENCSAFVHRHDLAFRTASGSRNAHHNWAGGYLDHLDECFGIAGTLYWALDRKRELPFSLSDAILVLWLHDIEKVWKYGIIKHRSTLKRLALTDKHALTLRVVLNCNLKLTAEQWNALKYIHGENEEYVSGEKKTGRLGAFVHMCDYWSARGWYDEPSKSGPLV